MEKIKAVILDWGGVLAEDPAPGLVRYCAQRLGVGQEDYKRAHALCMGDFQTGRVTEEEFWRNMTSRLKTAMPKEGRLWGEAFAAVYLPRPEFFTLAAALRKQGCKIALLSNTERPAVEFFRKQKYDMFDVTVFSCAVGGRKPQPLIYRTTLDRLGVRAEETVFVDDKSEYIKGAKRVGLKTIRFRSIVHVKAELSRMGLRF